MRIRSSAAAGLAFLAATVLAAPATSFAHHSFAMYDMNQEKTVSGTVVEFQWTNPHCWIWIQVPNESGVSEKWGIQVNSPNLLELHGWTKNTLKPGDKVTALVHPIRQGGAGGSFIRITLPGGKSLDMLGRGP
jgi:hypothetical protein